MFCFTVKTDEGLTALGLRLTKAEEERSDGQRELQNTVRRLEDAVRLTRKEMSPPPLARLSPHVPCILFSLDTFLRAMMWYG